MEVLPRGVAVSCDQSPLVSFDSPHMGTVSVVGACGLSGGRTYGPTHLFSPLHRQEGGGEGQRYGLALTVGWREV